MIIEIINYLSVDFAVSNLNVKQKLYRLYRNL